MAVEVVLKGTSNIAVVILKVFRTNILIAHIPVLIVPVSVIEAVVVIDRNVVIVTMV